MNQKKMTALSVVLLLSSSIVAERRGVINPIVPKTLRKEGESRQDMVKRLIADHSRPESFVDGHMMCHAMMKSHREEDTASLKGKKCQCCSSKRHCKNFKNFKGYWLLDSITYLSGLTLVEFFTDNCGRPFMRYFGGTQLDLRQRNANDEAFENFPAEANVIPVEVLGPRSLRLFASAPFGEDDLRCTFRIQDNDNDLAYTVYYHDSAEESVDNVLRYIRLPERPDIQLNRLPSLTDWTNPVEIFNYLVDYYALLGEPQKAVELNQVNYIGWPEYQALRETMLSTGVTREATVSTTYRGGKYLGVWRTQFPEEFPVTTIHTQEQHRFNPCSTITISGFKGAYAVLNGVQKAAASPLSTLTISTPFPWQQCTSREAHINILFDSSFIEEEYDPSIHGVATLEAHHGPITPDIGYREFMASLIDFVITSFGPGTHTRLALWLNLDLVTVPESFTQLQEGLARDELIFFLMRFRTYTANSFGLYWNPVVTRFNTLTFPSFNINDPFGVGLAEFNPYFDYDIPRQNYLEEGSVKNIFFTVTGPVLEDQLVTQLLEANGYTSNGSQVVFKANDFQTFPEPLVDEFGEHPYMLYAGADNSQESIEFASQQYFGGIVDRSLTGEKTVAYIRLYNETGFDDPFLQLTYYPLVFGRDDIPDKFTNNFVAAYASLLEELNQYNPDRYILDIRSNEGGFDINNAMASLFGGDRLVGGLWQGFPGNGERDPLLINGSGIQTVFDSIPPADQPLPNDIVASVFPNSAVRSSEKEIELIILTSTHSVSAGDILPHRYLGPDATSTVHDLGNGVTARIVGDIDGRLWAGAKLFDPPPIDPLSQNLVDSTGAPLTAVYMGSEGGLGKTDRNGFYVNETLATVPNVLLDGWYDQTEWQDIGLTPNVQPYQLASNAHGEVTPVFDEGDPASRKTWRDVWLENAIKN